MKKIVILFSIFLLFFAGCLIPNVYQNTCCKADDAMSLGKCGEYNTYYCVFSNYSDKVHYYLVEGGKISELDCSSPNEYCKSVGFCKIEDNGVHYVPICEEEKEIKKDTTCRALICDSKRSPFSFIPPDPNQPSLLNDKDASFYPSLLDKNCLFETFDDSSLYSTYGLFSFGMYGIKNLIHYPIYDNDIYFRDKEIEEKTSELLANLGYGGDINNKKTERFMNYLNINKDPYKQCSSINPFCIYQPYKSNLDKNLFLKNNEYLLKNYTLFNVNYTDINYEAYENNITLAYWNYNPYDNIGMNLLKKEYECEEDSDCASGKCGKLAYDYRRDFCEDKNGNKFDCYCKEVNDEIHCKPFIPQPNPGIFLTNITYSDSIDLCCHTQPGTWSYDYCKLADKGSCSEGTFVRSGEYVCCNGFACVPSSCNLEDSSCSEVSGGKCKEVKSTWICNNNGCKPENCVEGEYKDGGYCVLGENSYSQNKKVFSNDIVFFDSKKDGYIGYSYFPPSLSLLGKECKFKFDIEKITFSKFIIKSDWDEIKCYEKNGNKCNWTYDKIWKIKEISDCGLDAEGRPKLNKGYSWCDPLSLNTLHYINTSLVNGYLNSNNEKEKLLFKNKIDYLLSLGIFPVLNITKNVNNLDINEPMIIITNKENYNLIKQKCPKCLIALPENELPNEVDNKKTLILFNVKENASKESLELLKKYALPSLAISYINNLDTLFNNQKQEVHNGLFGEIYLGDYPESINLRPLVYSSTYAQIPTSDSVCTPCNSLENSYGLCSNICLNAKSNGAPATCEGNGKCGIQASNDCLLCEDALKTKNILCTIEDKNGKRNVLITSMDDLEPVYIGALPEGEHCCLNDGFLYTYYTRNTKGILKTPFIFSLDPKQNCGFDFSYSMVNNNCNNLEKPIKDFNVKCIWVDK